MDNKNYFSQRNFDCTKKINQIIFEYLPDFTREFFIGIENSTTSLTRLNYAYDLRVFFEYIVTELPRFANKKPKEIVLSDLDTISSFEVEQYLSYLSYYVSNQKKSYVSNSDRGKARKLASVRAIYKYFTRKEKIKYNPPANINTPKFHEKEIVRLSNEEVPMILDLAESGNLGSDHQTSYNKRTKLRDLAMITLFLGTGIRVSECVGLNVDDIDLKNNSFIVTRKGGNVSTLYFPEEVKLTLMAYMEERRSNEKVSSTERALFLSLQNKRLNVRSVENVVKKYARAINPLKKISPHKLRSTFGTRLYQSTRDIYVVADVLGHKDVNTTKKHYAAISDEIRRDASKKIVLRKEIKENSDE